MSTSVYHLRSFVVIVKVSKGRAPVYFTRSQKAYIRMSGRDKLMILSCVLWVRSLFPGSTTRMDESMVSARKELGRPSVLGCYRLDSWSSLLHVGDMPAVPRDFIGREHEIEQIRSFVALNKKSIGVGWITYRVCTEVRQVSLWGPPGCGKSVLARRLVVSLLSFSDFSVDWMRLILARWNSALHILIVTFTLTWKAMAAWSTEP